MSTKTRIGVCIGVLLAVAPMLRAQDALPQEDAARIEACRKAIVACHLTGGAIEAVGYQNPGQPVYIQPYFNNLTCLSLIDAHNYRPHPVAPGQIAELDMVKQWLEFVADHQAANGTISSYDGRIGPDGSATELTPVDADSHDATSAGILAVAAAYLKASNRQGNAAAANAAAKPSAKMITACRNALRVVNACKAPNGLYWNFMPRAIPKGKTQIQYTLDSIEVHQGLVGASEFFAAIGDQATADKATQDAAELASKMHQFWYPEQKYFVALFNDKAFRVPWGKQLFSAEGLATVSALAFFDNVPTQVRTDLWNRFVQDRSERIEQNLTAPDVNLEDPTIERIFFAARRAGTAEQQATWLSKLRLRTDDLLKRNYPAAGSYPYVHRFGMIIQALLAQRGDLPAGLPRISIQDLPVEEKPLQLIVPG